MVAQADPQDKGKASLISRFWNRLGGMLGLGAPEQEFDSGLSGLETRLGYNFRDQSLLANAMLHRSHVYVSGGDREESNERLEFLGDAVLGVVVSDHLYHLYPGRSEGDLTKMKSLLVCGNRLAEVAAGKDLGRYIRMSRSEAAAGGRKRPTILADATEAVIGAVYLDGGFSAAEQFIGYWILKESQDLLNRRSLLNFKSRLQELIQADHRSPPRYKVVSTEGPDHHRWFEVVVTFAGEVLGRGKGASKKAAEQEAARDALERRETLP